MSQVQVTRHTCGGPVFGRLDLSCPRCRELMEGYPARRWDGARRFNRSDSAQDIRSAYCFCPDTPLGVDRCPRCGKRPYTD